MEKNVDLPRLEQLTRYWRKFPPVHVLVAQYVGYKGPKEDIGKVTAQGGAMPSETDMQAFMDMLPQRALPKPVVRTNGDRPEP